MKFIKIIFIVISLYTIYYVLYTPVVSAQESPRTMTLVPPAVEKTLNPGDTSEGKMKIINDSNEPLTFTVSIQDFIVSDDIGTPNLLPPNTMDKKYSAASWIGVTPQRFTVEPHNKHEFAYYIQIPKDARPGGHYAAVVFSPKADGNLSSSGASVDIQIGTLFYILINGDVIEHASVSSMQAPGFQEYGPVSITTQIQNASDIHIKPVGQIVLKDIFGRVVDTQALSPNNIFPNVARKYDNVVGKQLMIGPFTAQLSASYGKSKSLPLSASVTFWVFPWRITLLIMLMIIAIILGVLVIKKKKNTTAANTQKDTDEKTKLTQKTKDQSVESPRQ